MAAAGELRFFENNTTTPKNVYDGADLSPSLGSTVTLDASGRAEDDVWLDGVYRVRLYTGGGVDGALVWSRDDVQGQEAGGITPLDPSTGNEDDVYGTDGVTASWRAIREVPDPTGNSGKYVGTDGTTVSWTAFPAATVYDEDTLPGSFTQTNTSAGGFTFGNIRVQWGSDTAPTAASVVTTKAVTFGVAFSGTPYTVQVTPTSGGVTSDTPAARCSAQALSANTTGFTASLFAGAEDEGSGSTDITSTVAFTWLAIGPV
ncbi:MAG: hypothetical protein A3E01_06935 [Gammaproteobacteria bacterium RIFCSPHIGHO2_12_FULL_63_22]|nr:MAG: hypothetical protein A3E01_06935 [Gammaproteobacteria bacterium RIFCSPHIGHO2_12_FULL_63_22]